MMNEMIDVLKCCGYEYLCEIIEIYKAKPYPLNKCQTDEEYQYWGDVQDFIWDNAALIMTEGTARERAWIMNEARDFDKEWNGEEFIQN